MNDFQPAIEAQGLGRRFGRYWALAHVELAVPQGETLLLAGPNGSGKTTLLRIIAGLYRPTRGGLRVFGLDPCKDRPNCRQLSMVSHDSYLYPRSRRRSTLQAAPARAPEAPAPRPPRPRRSSFGKMLGTIREGSTIRENAWHQRLDGTRDWMGVLRPALGATSID